jgi:hypothetical protein
MPVVMLGLVFFLARIEERHLGGPPPAADTEARRSGGPH